MKGCRKCRYWQGEGTLLERTDRSTLGEKVELGLCRRHPPRPEAARRADPEAPTTRLTVVWPTVASDDWCGDWSHDYD